MNRALRAATMGALLLSPVALSACSAGQVPQTATQNRDKVGPEAAVGDLVMRQITLAYPQDGLYAPGDDAELRMAIVNSDTEADTLRERTELLVRSLEPVVDPDIAAGIVRADEELSVMAREVKGGTGAADSPRQ